VAISVDRPILFDSDVVCLAGAEPTAVDVGPDGERMTYLAEKDGEPEGSPFAIPITLFFVHGDGRYRLQEGRVAKGLTGVVSPPVVAAAVRSVCDGEISVLSRTVDFDLTDIDPALLPTRSQVVELLGAPNARAPGDAGDALAYDYSVRDGDRRATAHVVARFDAAGTIRTVDVRYLGHRFEARFDDCRARLTAAPLRALGCAFVD